MQQRIAKAQGIATDVVAYRNASLFSAVNGDDMLDAVTIMVDGDRIAAIVPSAEDAAALPEGAHIVDADGWYAIPGLVDSHVHLATLPDRAHATAMLRRYLYGGITTVRDMAGDARALAELSRAALIGEIDAPDIKYAALMAGPGFFSDPRTVMAALGERPGYVSWLQAIDGRTNLPLAVAEARGTGATGIKIYANLSGELTQAIIAEGRAQDIPVWAHVEVYPADIYAAIGATAVSHVCMIAESLLRPPGAVPRSPEAMVDLGQFDVNAPAFQRYLKEMTASGSALDATAALSKKNAEARATGGPDEGASAARPVCPFDTVIDPILSALHAAGVPIVAGTDYAAPPDDPFPALVEEMETLEQVRTMSTADVIRSATVNAATVLGLADEIGSIEVGKYANIVFLKDDPLQGVQNLRSVVLTVKRGHAFFREDYEHQPIPASPDAD